MALYAKMKGPVGYTVVGSPTITDGVASEFSRNNYLTAPINPQNVFAYEEVIRVKIPSTFTQRNYITGYAVDKYGWALSIPYTTKIYAIAMAKSTSDTSAWRFDIATNVKPIYDQFYYIRFTWNGNRFLWEHSTDKENWSTIYSYNSSDFFYSSGNKLYGRGATNQSWYNDKFLEGEIDLKETYIRINGQLWFGYGFDRVKIRTAPYERYAVVGSPTISGGIASDFTKNNYVMTNSTFPGSTTTSLEFATKINVSSFSSTSTVASSTTSTIPFHLAVRDSKFRFYPGRDNIYKIGDFVLSANTNYWIKLFWDSTNGWKLQYSTDGVNYTTDFENYNPSNSAPKDNYLVIGRNYPNGGQEPFLGTIDLNETYIKVNGQYWWRGDMQYVETYTLHQGE